MGVEIAADSGHDRAHDGGTDSDAQGDETGRTVSIEGNLDGLIGAGGENGYRFVVFAGGDEGCAGDEGEESGDADAGACPHDDFGATAVLPDQIGADFLLLL